MPAFQDSRYRWLALLSVLATILAYGAERLPRGQGWLLDAVHWLLSALAANVAAGFIGAIATLYFVERKVEQLRDDERRRVAALALRDFGSVVDTAILVLSMLLVRTAATNGWAIGGKPPRSVAELFEERFISSLDWVNVLAASGMTGHLKQASVAGDLHLWSSGIVRWLNESLSRYAPFLDAEALEVIQAVQRDEYLNTLNRAKATQEALPAGRQFILCSFSRQRRQFFDRLLSLVRLYETRTGGDVRLPAHISQGTTNPSLWGSARLASWPPECP